MADIINKTVETKSITNDALVKEISDLKTIVSDLRRDFDTLNMAFVSLNNDYKLHLVKLHNTVRS